MTECFEVKRGEVNKINETYYNLTHPGSVLFLRVIPFGAGEFGGSWWYLHLPVDLSGSRSLTHGHARTHAGRQARRQAGRHSLARSAKQGVTYPIA